ncbi:bifunctional 2',3'-cyclic-nucleotide 2'-phosphodiesterase/3'-nucleotidase [Paucibacter soli]|uniref:bifunctional 2',3'-cyclic-nucleotide 2'-phosphodiesterase/3'-nucleotidase n=1 Tax=Paucibacter soli TaxID=3133433 RepID=UPI0030AEDAF0
MLACLAGLAMLSATQAADLKLRILETTDVHMNLLNYDYYRDQPTDEYGLAKTITLIKAARAEVANSLLFDNGDLLQGNPLGDLVARVQPLAKGAVHPAFKVLNELGVDAANIGNHEFNYGLPFLRQALAGARFPYVNANVRRAGSGAPAFTPSVMLVRRFKDEAGRSQRLKIAVFGLVPPQIMQWDKQHLSGRVQALDMVETARVLVPRLRAAGADLVIAIAHTGIETHGPAPLAENAALQLAQVPGLDALLLGHAHAQFPGPDFAGLPGVDAKAGRLHGLPAVMPGRWGDHLGLIDLSLRQQGRRWRVLASQSSLRPIYDRQVRRALVAADPAPARLIADEHARTLDHVRQQLASTAAPIHSYFAQVSDDPSVQLVAQAQLAYMARAVKGTAYEGLPLISAAAPFKSGGRQGWNHYTDIPAGPLAIKHVADLYVYPNTIKGLKLKGRELREWLEMAAGQFRQIDPAGPAEQGLIEPSFPSFNFDTLDGLTYEIDVTQPARYNVEGQLINPRSHRIQTLSHRGRAIDEEAEFLVVSNNYRANGGGHFPGLGPQRIVVDAPDENRAALTEYLAEAKHINPSADGNWRIRPVPGVRLQFVSGLGGIAHLSTTPAVRLVRELGDGSALYELSGAGLTP